MDKVQWFTFIKVDYETHQVHAVAGKNAVKTRLPETSVISLTSRRSMR